MLNKDGIYWYFNIFILRIKTFSSKYMITNTLDTIETNTGHPTLQQIKENQKA